MAETEERHGCSHRDQIQDVYPRTEGCEKCLQMGDTWVHLRLCRICGHVGCCNESKNKHATAHFHETGHPIIQSLEPGEDWGWCYVDEVYVRPITPAEAERERRERKAKRSA